MENAEKILAVKKNSLKNRRAHLNENWVVLGWRRASADRLLLLLLLALYLHFFDAHRGGRACHFYFYFLFLFFGKSVGPAPPHMRGRSSPTESNYAMSTSGRTFKLALIKYWLHVVFFINHSTFCEVCSRSASVGYRSICICFLWAGNRSADSSIFRFQLIIFQVPQ